MTDLADFDFLPLDADLDKFGWSHGDAEVSAPDPDEIQSLRFNPNHGADGKFSGGHSRASGANAGAAPVPAHLFPAPEHAGLREDLHPLRDRLAASAAGTGVNVHVASGGPLNAVDAKGIKEAAGRGMEAARVTHRPQVDAHRDHGLTAYRVGGKLVAHVEGNEDGSAWSATLHHGSGWDSEVKNYRTRDKAESNAERFARRHQKYEGSTHYLMARDAAALGRKVEDLVEPREAPKHDVYAYFLH